MVDAPFAGNNRRGGAMALLLHRWFVQYNPLYFASALFVLLGVFLLTRDPLDWARGQLGLAALIQLYELALIGAAAFLFNLPGQRRPAVILGIVALGFLFDVTFRTEALASVGHELLAASVLCGALFGVKLWLVARALRVRLPFLHGAAWTLGGVMLALGPQLIRNDRVLIAASWLGIALIAIAVWSRPVLRMRVALDHWGHIVAGRMTAIAPLFWALLYWTHVLAWCGIYDLALTPLCLAPAVVLVPFIVRGEWQTWIAAAIAMAVMWSSPAAFALLAAGLALKAHQHGLPRLYIAAVMAAYMAGPKWIAPALWISLATVGVLVLLAWRFRLRSALAAALIFAVPALVPWLPAKAGQWGALLVAAGFVALGAGVALNWWSVKIARDADLRIRLPLVRP
jgi:hypothetical protein